MPCSKPIELLKVYEVGAGAATFFVGAKNLSYAVPNEYPASVLKLPNRGLFALERDVL